MYIKIFLIFTALIFVAFMGVSEDEIQKCVETTNYSYDRCLMELSR